MRWIGKFDLYLFDLDGLLVDTERLHFAAYKALFESYGHSLEWEFKEYIQIAHTSADGLQEALHPLLKDKQPNWETLYLEKKQIYLQLLRKGKLELMPGVEKLLKELSTMGIKRCVVTHSSKELVEMIKTRLPILQSIPVWITREDYDAPKPASDGYHKAIELLADPGDKMIGFEDSLRGLKALMGTPAKPILVCDPAHPQLKKESLEGISKYPSMDKILSI
jgi:HAD superfamily hydrolase (TIGR01509 family)